jgi:hypothetical protein
MLWTIFAVAIALWLVGMVTVSHLYPEFGTISDVTHR